MQHDLFTSAHRASLLAACLLALAGCRDQTSPSEAHGDHEEHAGHVIPAHKPKTFPEAVHRLRELNDQIGREVVAGATAPSSGAGTLHIALDIANWLPEIAADCDMPETPWNVVDARSAALAADYQAILSSPAAGTVANELENAGKAIADLEALLASADTRWFAGTKKEGGH
jgi:hypothetical protein